MKKLVYRQKIIILITTILCVLIGVGVYAGIQSEVGTYVWDSVNSRWIKSTTSGSTVIGNNTPSDSYTNPTNAVNVTGLNMGWDPIASKWKRLFVQPAIDNSSLAYDNPGLITASALYSRADNGALSNWIPIMDYAAHSVGLASGVTGAIMTAVYGRDLTNGGIDPINILPTAADTAILNGGLVTDSVLYGFNGSTYDRIGSGSLNADNIGSYTTGNLRNMAFLYGYDSAGGNWDRAHMDASGSLYVNPGTLSNTTDSVTIYPPDPGYAHIASNTSTQVKSAAGYLFGISINTAGVTGNIATVYDNTSCATTIIAVIDTTAKGNIDMKGLKFNTGLCIATATGTAADLTVIYK